MIPGRAPRPPGRAASAGRAPSSAEPYGGARICLDRRRRRSTRAGRGQPVSPYHRHAARPAAAPPASRSSPPARCPRDRLGSARLRSGARLRRHEAEAGFCRVRNGGPRSAAMVRDRSPPPSTTSQRGRRRGRERQASRARSEGYGRRNGRRPRRRSLSALVHRENHRSTTKRGGLVHREVHPPWLPAPGIALRRA